MAKAKKHESDGETEAGYVTVHLPADLVLTYGDWSIDAATASPATLAYCLQNGFHQSLVDAAAFSKEEKEGKTDNEIATMAFDKRQARFENIVNGTVGHRAGGPRAKGVDVYIRDILDKMIADRALKLGAKLPSGKGAAEVMQGYRDKLMSQEHVAAAVRAKAQRSMEEDKALAESVDLFTAA